MSDDQKRMNRAVEIANKVNKFLWKQVMREEKSGEQFPLLLEDMALAYAIAMSNYSIYKNTNHQRTWNDFTHKALDAVKIACDHIQVEIDKQKTEQRNAYPH